MPAEVKEADDQGIMLLLQAGSPGLKPGALALLRAEGEETEVGWAAVDSVRTEDEGVLIRLSPPQWEESGETRARRSALRSYVVASFVDPAWPADPKRTIGMTVNISISGVRIRTRGPIPVGALAHLSIYLTDDAPVIALARVMRIVEGEQGQEGGYDVGLAFIRFLQGYRELLAAVTEDDERLDDVPDEAEPASNPSDAV